MLKRNVWYNRTCKVSVINWFDSFLIENRSKPIQNNLIGYIVFPHDGPYQSKR